MEKPLLFGSSPLGLRIESVVFRPLHWAWRKQRAAERASIEARKHDRSRSEIRWERIGNAIGLVYFAAFLIASYFVYRMTGFAL